MLGYGDGATVTVADCWGVEEGGWVFGAVLVFGREVTVVDVPRYGGHFEGGCVPFEVAFEGVDWYTFGWTCFLFKVLAAKCFCDRFSN
jgi:hypothetical protein